MMMMLSDDDSSDITANIASLASLSSSSLSSLMDEFHFARPTSSSLATATTDCYIQPYYQFDSNWPPESTLVSSVLPINSSSQKRSATTATSKSKPKRRRIATVTQRRAANVRERKRMFSLNEAFDTLREIVPIFAYEKKLSRIETLRLAIIYIAFMTEVVMSGKTVEEASLNADFVLSQWPNACPYQMDPSAFDDTPLSSSS